MHNPLYNENLNDSDIQNNDFSNLNPNNHITDKTIHFTTPDNTLQPSLTSNLNATLRFTAEQDDRPILGDDSEDSNE